MTIRLILRMIEYYLHFTGLSRAIWVLCPRRTGIRMGQMNMGFYLRGTGGSGLYRGATSDHFFKPLWMRWLRQFRVWLSKRRSI